MSDITATGLTSSFYDQLNYVAHGEEGYVIYLETGLKAAGSHPVASAFIISCPLTNAALPVTAYPSRNLESRQRTTVGAVIALKPKTDPTCDIFAASVRVLDIIVVRTQGFEDGRILATVPLNRSGQTCVFLTKDNSSSVADAIVLFGPAIIGVTSSSPTFDLTSCEDISKPALSPARLTSLRGIPYHRLLMLR